MIHACKKAQKFLSFILISCLIFSQGILPTSAATFMQADSELILQSQSEFSDGQLFGFTPGGSTTATIIDQNGNKVLQTNGSGSGTRSIVKTFSPALNHSKLSIVLDWNPGLVTTASNSSELLIQDVEKNPIFRVVKLGGTNGAIHYGFGNSGADLTGTLPSNLIIADDSWIQVQMDFDFVSEKVLLSLTDLAHPENKVILPDFDLKNIQYVNHIGSLSVVGNRASGQSLAFTTFLDNIAIYTNGESAPAMPTYSINTISSDYTKAYQVANTTTTADLLTLFPSKMDVLLENGKSRSLTFTWQSDDYTEGTSGSYSFIGTPVLEGTFGIDNEDAIQAHIQVDTLSPSNGPTIDGYNLVHYSDFGDTLPVTPLNWGFTTANATLSIHSGMIASDSEGVNSTPKLSFAQINQSGGRVASKNFTPAIGEKLLLRFHWFPGKVNDKGSTSTSENGGEIRILDNSGNVIFTLRNTNQSPLEFFVGTHTPIITSFTNPNLWYDVELSLDLLTNKAVMKMTQGEISVTQEFSLDGMAFDGSLASFRFVGNRTASNNISWTTYLDNFGIYSIPVPANRISKVNQLPYHRVYLGETTNEIASIGLPTMIDVTLADGSITQAAVSSWVSVNDTWDSSKSGVYAFKGILATSETLDNTYNLEALCYVYNRFHESSVEREAEWLDRGFIALSNRIEGKEGIFLSWRILSEEYKAGLTFNLYRNGVLVNPSPLQLTNYNDAYGKTGDFYRLDTIYKGNLVESNETTALAEDYLRIPMQKPEGGTTPSGDYTYSVNDVSVGDVNGDGQYEYIVKWYPSNAIDSSQSAMTGPTIFDAYTLEGNLLWRINMGHNLTSGAHYNQLLVYDFDGDSKAEVLLKTADGTVSNNASGDILSQIGDVSKDGAYINESGKVTGGPEYISIFNGETGVEMDRLDYRFGLDQPGSDVLSWGDNWHNRSDRFLAGVAYLDGQKPSALIGRGYYERTTYVAYDYRNGELTERWYFDSNEINKGAGLGFHSLAIADVDNDGYDEVIAGSLTLDEDGSILYAMDGQMQRETGSHGDALHVAAFDPNREGVHVIAVHEVPAVASLEYHDGATGETLMSFFASKDAGRGVAANITSSPGYEFWGNAGYTVSDGGAIYNVQGGIEANDYRSSGVSVNFKTYWDGDLLHELLDGTSITKYNESTQLAEMMRDFSTEDVVSNNGTKANPSLQADVLGDWREEILYPTSDSSELRLYSTTYESNYVLPTLMHDPVYRLSIAWQNVGYNQPPNLGFYLGEDISSTVTNFNLPLSNLAYTLDHSILKEITPPNVPNTPSTPNAPVTPSIPTPLPTPSTSNGDELQDEDIAQNGNSLTAFRDIKGWYKDSILFLQNLGIVNGIQPGLFAPQNNVKRCEIIKMLAVMNEAPIDKTSFTSTSVFNDVAFDSWYAPYLVWAKEIGLILGDPNGNFRPDENLSREDIAVLISRYHQITQGSNLSIDSYDDLYSDHELISSYAMPAIYGLRLEGLMQGIGKNLFAPNKAITRGEASQLLSNYIQK